MKATISVELSGDKWFDLAGATAALGLTPSSLRREVRLGRLKASRRCGKVWLSGYHLNQWLREGSTDREKRREAMKEYREANVEKVRKTMEQARRFDELRAMASH